MLSEKLTQAKTAINAGDAKAAVELLDEIISARPDNSVALYQRGREQFKLNEIEKSVADFDAFVKLQPDQRTSQWERGIALFYAGRFQDGADQFDAYQTFHNADVENGAWKFLCMTQAADIETARASMLDIEGDSRVPMTEIYEMYRGNIEPQDVIATVRRNDPRGAERTHQWFYAYLYVGLYEEARGNKEAAEESLRKAVGFKIEHYMWNVADVHVKRKYPDRNGSR